MTASAVSAIDFGSNHYPQHNTANFRQLFWNSSLPVDNDCWVSYKCFQPQLAVYGWMLPALASLPNLVTYLNTVVTGAQLDGEGNVVALTAVQRTPKAGTTGWEQLLSAQVEDWYSPVDSPSFSKSVLTFSNPKAVIEATEFGDVFGSSGLDWAQGIEANNENDTTYIDYCGQGVTVDFYLSYGNDLAPSPDPFPPGDPEGAPFSNGNETWDMIWSYRRVVGLNSSFTQVKQGETSLQNWGGGNDYDTGYIFLPLVQAQAQKPWRGGLNLTAMAQAEQRAYGWYHYYKGEANASMAPYLTLNTSMSGTPTGLAKMPYLRDARRAPAGIQDFRLTYEALNTTNRPQYPDFGTYWNDTIAIGQYNSDIHMMRASACPTPKYLHIGTTKEYYLPFRALTHRDSPNLLVAGKNMAQSFWANAATRLHPEEWGTGTAAGVAAGLMAEHGWSSSDVYTNKDVLQARLQSATIDQPLTWAESDA